MNHRFEMIRFCTHFKANKFFFQEIKSQYNLIKKAKSIFDARVHDSRIDNPRFSNSGVGTILMKWHKRLHN
jgi:hypothetical protein